MRVHKKDVSNWRGRVVVMGAIVATVALVGTRVWADDASDIESFYQSENYVTYDNTSGDYPVITALASQPGVIGGHTYTGWSLLAQDATGSLDLFVTAATLTNLQSADGAGTAYTRTMTPAVGDAINAAGAWSPFDQIPELAFSTVVSSNNYINKISGGNTVPTAPVFSVSNVNIPDISNHVEFAGTLIEIQGATLSGSTGSFMSTFPTYAQANTVSETYTLTDNTGSMTMFDWVTSYSACGALGGSAVPTETSQHLRIC